MSPLPPPISSSKPIESCLNELKTSSPAVIKSAIQAIKEHSSAEVTEEISLGSRCHFISENALITNLVTSLITKDEALTSLAEQNQYASAEEYVIKELFQSLFDQTIVTLDNKNTWLVDLIPSSLDPQTPPTENILSSFFGLIDSRLAEVETVEKATDLGWVSSEQDKAAWPSKLSTWKDSYAQFKTLIESNAPKTLFSSDPATRKQQYLSFCSNFLRDLPIITSKNMDYDFYDTQIPYLLSVCFTAWSETSDQLHSQANSLQGRRELDLFSLAHQITKSLRKDVLLNRVLPEAIRANNPTSSNETIQDLISDVHNQKALKQWANTTYHLGFSAQELGNQEWAFGWLSPHFEAITPAMMVQHYTPTALMNELSQFYNEQSENKKDLLWAPFLDAYRTDLVKGKAPYIDEMPAKRALYQKLSHTQEIENFNDYTKALKTLHLSFTNLGISPPFSASTPKELAETALKKSELNSAMTLLLKQKKEPPPTWREALAAKRVALDSEKEASVLELIANLEASESPETIERHLAQQKTRIGEVLNVSEEQIARDNAILLKSLSEDRAGHLRPFGAALFGCGSKVLEPPLPGELPQDLLNWAAKLPVPRNVTEELVDKLKDAPELYLSLSEDLKNLPEVQALTIENPGLKYGIKLEIYQSYLNDPIKALTWSEAKTILNKDINFILAGMTRDRRCFKYADVSLFNNKEFGLAIAVQNGDVLQLLTPLLRSDKEIVLAAVKNSGGALEFASHELKADKDVVLASMIRDRNSFKYADASLFNNKEFGLAITAQKGDVLKLLSPTLRADKEIVLAAVTNSGGALEFASHEIKADKEIALAAITQNGRAFRFASEALRHDEELILKALPKYGGALKFASAALKNNKSVVLAAVTQDGTALQFASENLKNDKEIALAALSKDPRAWDYISLTLQDDEEIKQLRPTDISDFYLY